MDKSSKGIFERQNLPGLLTTQLAANRMYYKGKILVFAKFCICILIPVVFNMVALFYQHIVGVVFAATLSSICCFIVGKILNNGINWFKLKGAQLQEYFDEVVFEIHGVSTHRIQIEQMSTEERIAIVQKYENKDAKGFENWYSDYSFLTYTSAVFRCQKENIRWDKKEREQYKILLFFVLAVLSIPLIVLASVKNPTWLVIVSIISVIIPFFDFCYSSFVKLNKDIKYQNAIYSHMNSIEKQMEVTEVAIEMLEELQVEIFEYRKNSYLIPETFYRIVRKRIQNEEDCIAKELQKTKVKKDESNDTKTN